MARVCGDRFLKLVIDEYLETRIQDKYESDIVGAYTFQIFMKKSQQEMVLLVMFDNLIQSYLPLESKLKQLDYPEDTPRFPIAIIMGDDDWVQRSDDGASKKLINHLQSQGPEGANSNYYILPTSGHNLNLDNRHALVNIIFNECFGGQRPILRRE